MIAPAGYGTPLLRTATADDVAAVATLMRRTWRRSLPFLPVLHTPAEDHAYFAGVVFRDCTVLLAETDGVLRGFLAWRPGWIDQFYVAPEAQRQGIGTRLLAAVQAREDVVSLWTFTANGAARAFYARHGFTEIDRTDGAGNEERAPDVLLRWRRA
jgi:GNAT superfamily N-acetyltransferase